MAAPALVPAAVVVEVRAVAGCFSVELALAWVSVSVGVAGVAGVVRLIEMCLRLTGIFPIRRPRVVGLALEAVPAWPARRRFLGRGF